jgi:hypothetical protein
MKAMKEAMPAYPDDDDAPDSNETMKNYATVSLCCLSVTNPFRNKIIQLVVVNPWFDKFILFVIMVNCIFLALDMEVDMVTENNNMIDLIFLQIYTTEMILKIIAMGFFMRAHSYLRDSWNIVSTPILSSSNSFFLAARFHGRGPWLGKSIPQRRRYLRNQGHQNPETVENYQPDPQYV